MNKITTILFDFDGTIMDTREVVLLSWQHTFMTLEGKERDPDEIYKTFGEPLKYTMARFFPGTKAEAALQIYRSYQKDNFAGKIKVFPGMKELLEEIKKNGYHTALVTSRLKCTALEGIAQHGLTSYFDELVTCDDTEKHKPDPEPILAALRKLGRRPEEALMIGDTMFDIQCAKNARVQSVLVNWSESVSEEEKNGAKGPDFMIEKPMDLMDLLKALA